MIRIDAVWRRVKYGAPRVSGDDPYGLGLPDKDKTCTPRERG